jgi:hypothetical protein
MHTKNPLAGWDISATATAEKAEKTGELEQVFVSVHRASPRNRLIEHINFFTVWL